MTSTYDPAKVNLKELFPAHSRKIDILEQRISGPSTLSNDAITDTEKAEEEVLDSDEEEQPVTPQKVSSDEPPKTNRRDSTHKYGRFSQEEDRKIIEGYSKFGNKWDEIARWGNLDRTSSQISSRFTRKLCKTSTPGKDDTSSRTEADEQPPTKQRRVDAGARENVGRDVSASASASASSASDATAAAAAPNSSSTTSSSGNDALASPTTNHALSSSRNGIAPNTDNAGASAKGDEEPDHIGKSERERIAGIEQGLKEREGQLVEWENRLKDFEWRLQQKSIEEHKKLTEFICEQLVGRARAERALARKKLAEDCVRFGQSSYERRGMEMIEMWQDGELFRQIDDQMKALAKNREALEAKKKQLAKNRQAGKAPVADGGASSEEEILKVRIMAIKREEAVLQEERERLHAPKLLHMKELKRATDEDQAPLSDFKRLHDGRYLLLSLLGKGGFSEVYLAFDLKELRHVACKIHSVNTMWSVTKRQNYTKHAIREYKIHKELLHERVVKLFDVFEIDSSSFCTVLEYCEGGDLDSYLKQNKILSEREAKCIVAQIFSGLKYLTSQKRPIIHYDLKPGNILFNNGEVKITDFGLSKIMEEDSEFVELTSQGAGTYWYLPPECFEMGGKQPPMISSKVDVWSVGVIFYQLLYGKKPFGNDMSQQKFLSENVAAQTTRVDFPSKPVVSKEAKDFLQKCLTHNQMLRPDVQSCCADPFLSQVRSGGKKTAPVPPASSSNPQMPPPKGNTKRKIDSE